MQYAECLRKADELQKVRDRYHKLLRLVREERLNWFNVIDTACVLKVTLTECLRKDISELGKASEDSEERLRKVLEDAGVLSPEPDETNDPTRTATKRKKQRKDDVSLGKKPRAA